eukprot:TRINITY_DN34847_c0_g1_i1.p1 TRINITY_DN34847_c0_g1~~TRINITY_DN34847_c0_g1_i1.p1  ORF type:complete len:467 (+),score=81.05 TRINITY_DN34847_c0_g1_i1:150-1550(+)
MESPPWTATLWLLVLRFLPADTQVTSQDTAKACAEAFHAQLDELLAYSGLPATLPPDDVHSMTLKEKSWSKLTGMNFHDKTHVIFEAGDVKVTRCWMAGGRVWEVEATGLYADAPAGRVHRTAICAPALCSGDDVKALVPSFYGTCADGTAGVDCIPPIGAKSDVYELGAWSQIQLDFAVIGCESCGSTSLHRNLGQHPEIGFTTDYEDGFFAVGGSPVGFEYLMKHKVVPLKTQVEEFNTQRWAPSSSVPKPLVRGSLNPRVHSEPYAYNALLKIPKLRFVAIVCDPLSRLEKLFYYKFCLRGAEGECRRNIREALTDDSLLEMFPQAETLTRIQNLAGVNNVLIVPQQYLKEAPRQTYDGIATFVGAKNPFPASMEFKRYNSIRGERTGLCRSKALVVKLKRRLAREYAELEQVILRSGLPVPRDLALRRTRCDRPEELQNSSSEEKRLVHSDVTYRKWEPRSS